MPSVRDGGQGSGGGGVHESSDAWSAVRAKGGHGIPLRVPS